MSHKDVGLECTKEMPGRIYSVDGQRLLRIYGPHSAPTQNLTKYDEVFVVTSGIGVTPLNSCMKSVVLHKWKYDVGTSKPTRVHFAWITRHCEIQRFRWFVRTVKDVCDNLVDILGEEEKQGSIEEKDLKRFSFRIFVTRIDEKVKTVQLAKVHDFHRLVESIRNNFY